MIYTIGYQRLAGPLVLAAVLSDLNAALFDCRAKPTTRKPGFGGRQLAERFGNGYAQCGHELGGFGNVKEAALVRLADTYAHDDGPHVLLMCMEEAPGECHRHHDIAVRLAELGTDAFHIYRDEVILAADLALALEHDGDYDLSPSPLSDATTALLSQP